MSAIIKDREEANRLKFQQAVESQHTLAVRTAEAMRKVELVPGKDGKKTEVTDFAKGQVDPQMQMLLIARDGYVSAEEEHAKLGYLRLMRELLVGADAKVQSVLKMAMEERHHQEKLAAMREKANLQEPSDAEIDAALEDEAK